MTCAECGFELRDDACGACAFRRARMENRREALRREMDRPPQRGFWGRATWRNWFDWPFEGETDFWVGEYLGTRSSRTGPDPVGAAQRCDCETCVSGRHAAM